MGLPEQLHSDQGAQFKSQLMHELHTLWRVDKTKTAPCHLQANRVVERNNRGLGESLRALLPECGQDEWDTFLPHLMRAFRGTPPLIHRRDSQFHDVWKGVASPTPSHI